MIAAIHAEANPPIDDSGIDYSEPPRLPLEPTDAVPGTRAKVLIMRERVGRGESPFHPHDAKLEE